MNKHNVKYWETETGFMLAEWADRALDDDDRYADDSIIITVTHEKTDNPIADLKRLNGKMAEAYDQWLTDTGRR